VKHRTAVVNQVRGLLLEYGIIVPQGIARLRKRLPRVLEEADNGLSFLMRDLLQRLQSELSALDTRITEITGQLTRLSHELEACQRLQEMEGIGPLSATALVAALGHGHNFHIPTDLVVKCQTIDNAEVIFSRIWPRTIVHTSYWNRKGRCEPLSPSEAHQSTTKSSGI